MDAVKTVSLKPRLPLLNQASHFHRELLSVGLIVAAVLWIYWPARSGEFILDDDLLLTHNSTIQSSDGLFRIWWPWNSTVADQPLDYWPVSNTTLWLEWRLWGLN